VIVSPLLGWIWIGGVIVVSGTMVALWPAPRRARRRAAAPVTTPVYPGASGAGVRG
jgi:cytochrome c biogenesis factor